MGRAPCCDKANVKKGPWSPEEDSKLKDYIEKYGTGGNWIALPQKAGLKRCGKSCRLRWLNYLRPNIKHGEFSDEEDRIICSLFATIGSRWSIIAAHLPGRTDNDIKNYWNTKLKKKLMAMAASPNSHRKPPLPSSLQAPPPPPPPSPPSSSSLYKDFYSSFYTNSTKSFSGTGLELPIINPNLMLSNSSSANSLLQNQDQSFLLSSMQQSYYPNVKDQSNFLVFGSDQTASCSSSDGSCSQNNISNGPREIKQEDHHHRSFMSNGYHHHHHHQDQDHQKYSLLLKNMSLANYNNNCQYWADQDKNQNFNGEESRLDYGDVDLDQDVKQLVNSSNTVYNDDNNSNNYFFFNIDENKTQQEAGDDEEDQKVMMYFYNY